MRAVLLAAALLALAAGSAAGTAPAARKGPGICAMSGICHKDGLGRSLLCANNTDAFEPDFNVSALAPALAGSKVCCTEEQYNQVVVQTRQTAPFFGPCPACYTNFRELWATYACSPNQSEFVEVLGVVPATATSKAYVNHTHYEVGVAYGNASYESCVNVRASATGGTVLGVLFGDPKTPQEWFQFMGNYGFTTSPYQIDVTVNEDPSAPGTMHAPTHPCNSKDPAYKCVAYDCPAPTPPPHHGGGHNGSGHGNSSGHGHHGNGTGTGTGTGTGSDENTRERFAVKIRLGDENLVDPAYLGAAGGFVLALAAVAVYVGATAKGRGARVCAYAAAAVAVAAVAGVALACGHSGRRESVLMSRTTVEGTYEVALGGDVSVLESRFSYALFVPLAVLVSLLVLAVLGLACLSRGRRSHHRRAAGAGDAQGKGKAGAAPLLGGEAAPRSDSSLSAGSTGDDDDDDDDDGDADAAVGDHGSAASGRGGGRSLLYPAFAALARLSARHSALVVLAGCAFTAACGSGIARMEVVTSPLKMWAPTDAAVVQRKDEFDSMFGPFYRVEQMVLRREDGGLASTAENVRIMSVLQARIEQTRARLDNGTRVGWEDLCYRPIPGRGCVRESVTEYFWRQGGVHSNLTDREVQEIMYVGNGHSEGCTRAPTLNECRGSIGALIFPYVVLGGFPAGTKQFNESTALITTYLLDGATANTDAADAWEREVLPLLAEAKEELRAHGLLLSYSLQVSVQDEIKRAGSGSVLTIGVSYVVMFLYISLAMGRLFPWDGRLVAVRTRFMLGLGAIFIVLCSLVISLGLCSYAGVKMTPIIGEVIPFLVLAVGIDNVFMLLNAFQSMDPRRGVEERLEETLGTVGVSVTLAAVSEATAFLLGGLTRMPAVQAFAFYSGAAILADYLLQITVFVAFMAMDARRRAAHRVDCVPCLQLRANDDPHAVDYRPAPEHEDEAAAGGAAASRFSNPRRLILRDGLLRKAMRRWYLPALERRGVRAAVLLLAAAAAAASGAYQYHNLELGLDQKQAVPRDSYLQGYFDDVATVLRVGPPVYFVIRPGEGQRTNFSRMASQDEICGGFNGCSNTSLSSLEAAANARSVSTYLADASSGGGPAVWVNEFFDFLQEDGPCCRLNATTGELCDPEDPRSGTDCVSCVQKGDVLPPSDPTHARRVLAPTFDKYLRHFLYNTSCTAKCGSCGWAHAANVVMEPGDSPQIKFSRTMNYQAPLKTQSDFIDAYEESLKLADKMSDETGLDIFSYSVFQPFFAQYVFMRHVTAVSVAAAMGVALVFVLMFCPPGSSLCVVVSIAAGVAELLALCAAWNVKLNAVSAVNTSVAIGVFIEFHSHVAVAFSRAPGTRTARVRAAMLTAGNSVFQGVFLTKILGVVVLGFAPSEIIVVYYFRMLLLVVLIGAVHGLLVLPVLLAVAGSPAKAPAKAADPDAYVPLDNAAAEPSKASYGTF